jgi:hypothetical protein
MKIKINLKKDLPISIKHNLFNKIKIKSKSNKIKLKKGSNCPICNQTIDLCVISHKNKPFVDNKCYSEMCFTCYHVPKVSEQKYDEKGYIIEEVDLEYSIKNLNSPEELFDSGSADSLECAKRSVRAVKNLKILKSGKDKKIRPKLEHYLL